MTTTIASNKLTIPSLPGLVRRERALGQLDAATWRIAAVSAPAGFGKTSALATWAAARAEQTAWLSCDIADREPNRFWSAVVAAVSARWPGVGDDVLATLRRGGLDDDASAALANELADVAEPVTIVLDDLHLAEPDPRTLASLINALPPTTRLVLGSRLVPAALLGRLRLRSDLLELRADDLRFTRDEMMAVLRNNGLTLEDPEIAQLHELSEGWPAAVQLAAMSMKDRADRGRFLAALASTDLAMTDFLVSEVLDQLPADWVEFLLSTCVLDEFDGALCARLTGRDDAEAMLRQLLFAGLFVIPLDSAGQWFRYHHLFGAFLRARLKARGVRRFAELNRRASAALEERCLVVEAMRLAIDQDDADAAAHIARRAFGQGLHPLDLEVSCAAIRLWLREYGEAAVDDDPIRVAALLAPLIFSSPTEDIERWLSRIGAAHPDPSALLTGYLHAGWCEYHLARGETDQVSDHLERALAPWGGSQPDHPDLVIMPMVAIKVHLACGALDRARAVAEDALARPSGHQGLDGVRFPAVTAWIAFAQGDLVAADRWSRSVLRIPGEVDPASHEPGHPWAWLVAAGLHAERLEDDQAADALVRARQLADRLVRRDLQFDVIMQQAAFARSTGDAESARVHLDVARSVLANPSPTIAARLDLEAARQLIRFAPNEAGPLVEALGDDVASLLVKAGFAVGRGDRTTASKVLESLPATVTLRQGIERSILHAVTAVELDESRRALEEALDAAAPHRFIRTWMDAWEAVAPLLAQATPSRHETYVATIAKAVATEPAPPAARVSELAEPLSTTEITVLRYLSSRLTNREIAAALYVSINTLKTHVKSIYRKLAVSSRDEAVAAGQNARLI